MPHVDIKAEFHLHVSPAEMRLIRAALAGRLRPDEAEAAAALGKDIGKRQATATDTYLKANQKILDNLEKEGG